MTGSADIANEAFIDTRQVRQATITVISEGGLLWPPRFPVPEAEWRAALPDADEQGRVWLGLNVVFVRIGDALVLIDPGLDDPDSAWQRDLATVWPDWPVRRTPGLAVALSELGIAPRDVTHVIITHPHGDHYAGVAYEKEEGLEARFPQARHFMGRADWQENPNRGVAGSAFARLELIDELGLLELVDDELEVTPGVTILSAPGESPGHCIVRIESNGERFYILGDLVHLACEVDHPTWGPPHVSAETLAAVRGPIFAQVARERALAMTAHERFPPWGRIAAEGEGFRWERC
jgi:glyoxylase-like metal-dependent hydrolase (beta-lactamase superfamily II)